MSQVHEELRRVLSVDEQVLWSGQPRQGLVVRSSDAIAIPFSLLWCGFAIFWETSVIRRPTATAFFVFWGILFVGVGIYLVVGRFFAEAKQRTRTFYAVTTKRIVIVSGLFSRKVRSLSLRTLAEPSLVESKNGEGSILFGGSSAFGGIFGGMSSFPGTSAQIGPRFDLIPQAKSVFEIIRNAQRSAS